MRIDDGLRATRHATVCYSFHLPSLACAFVPSATKLAHNRMQMNAVMELRSSELYFPSTNSTRIVMMMGTRAEQARSGCANVYTYVHIAIRIATQTYQSILQLRCVGLRSPFLFLFPITSRLLFRIFESSDVNVPNEK